jgi:hypothetical protein
MLIRVNEVLVDNSMYIIIDILHASRVAALLAIISQEPLDAVVNRFIVLKLQINTLILF